MDNTSSNRGSTTFPQSVSDESAPDTSFPSTSVAAAAPESSTLAVKLSEDPEGQVRSGDNGSSDDGHASYREDLRPALKEGERESRGQSPAIRRSRSGRLLRSTVQYDERSSRSSSPDNSAELQGSYGRRARSSLHNPSGQSEGQGHPGRSEQDLTAPRRDPPASTAEGKQRRPSEASDNDNDNDNANKDSDNHRVSQQGDSSHQDEQYEDENQDELASEDDQEDDGYGEEGDDVNNEGSGSIETSSSRNDDGSEPLVVSMYGSPSLVKVRSMFIDKLFKMVEDPSIQHLISWAKEGDMFYVYNCIELSSSVLPKFFKHNNWQSFVRQLNMYGFHKIYRYDREESTMNRRNPETQRWQFYHPDFQRDRPHLRNNIKRKSARSANIAPTFSRVVFERDKGFYVQQEAPARPFNVQGGHSRSHSSSHSLDQHRHGHLHGAPPPGPPHYAPHPSPMHRSPHETSQRLPASRSAPDYRPPPGHYPNENVHSRDEKDMVTSKHHVPPPHQQQPIREHDPHHHQNYPGPHYNQQQQQQQQQPPYGSPHQRQRSYVGQPSQAHYSPEHGYSLKAQGFSPIHPPPQDPHHSSMPLSHPTGPGRPGHGSNRDPGNPEHGHDKHGALMSGGHFRSQSAPGMDPRREIPRGPHPFSQQEPRSPLHLSPHPYYQREPYPPHGHPSHRQQGSFDESAAKVPPGPEAGPVVGEGSSPSHRGSLPKHPLSPMGHSQSHLGGVGHPPPSQVQHPYTDQHRRSYVGGPGEQDDPKRRFSPPTPGASFRPAQQRHAMVPPSPSHQQHPPLESGLPGEILPTTPGMDPNANPGPHDLIPRTTKQLESRLQFVEDAYMSLRQAVLDLEGIQATQEQTIAWMRDRIDQLTEASTPRDVITSPSLGQAGVVPSKRKADYSPGDPRDWPRRGAPEHQQQHVYSRQGLPPSGGPPPPLGQRTSPGAQGHGSRYESAGYHPSFNPIHHPSQHPPPPTPPSQHQQVPPQHQQQQLQQQQQQHPSPPMNANSSHYQKASITNMIHD